jgi:hypothetical protein
MDQSEVLFTNRLVNFTVELGNKFCELRNEVKLMEHFGKSFVKSTVILIACRSCSSIIPSVMKTQTLGNVFNRRMANVSESNLRCETWESGTKVHFKCNTPKIFSVKAVNLANYNYP